VQVDPFKSMLKAPGTKRLKQQNDEPRSNFAFKFSLRRYTKPSPLATSVRKQPDATDNAAPPEQSPSLLARSMGKQSERTKSAAVMVQVDLMSTRRQGHTLVTNSAQLELFCPPCNPT